MQYIPVRSAWLDRRGRRAGDAAHARAAHRRARAPLHLAVRPVCAHDRARERSPSARTTTSSKTRPRVGDGVIVLDPDLRVRFASPNAVSSMHRMGIHSYASGVQLVDMDFDQHAAAVAVATRAPVTEEIEHGDTSLLVRAIPFLDGDEIAGVVVLARDVTDLRRRDRMLLSKDATIREIHHRVKNNLQTIAALLRLQGRRLESGEARAALEESERRIRAIAIVHETLSRGVGRRRAVRRHPAAAGEGRAGDGRDARRRSAFRGGRRRRPAARRRGDTARGGAQRADAERCRSRVSAGRRRVVGSRLGAGRARNDGVVEVDVVDDGIGSAARTSPSRGHPVSGCRSCRPS